jgi:hypothetical protein
MITRNFVVVALAAAVIALGCEPETFHAHLNASQPIGAAGTGILSGGAGVSPGAGPAGDTGSGAGTAGITGLPTGDAGTGAGGPGAAGINGGAAGTTGGAGTGQAGTGAAGTGQAGTGAAGTGQAGTGAAGTGGRRGNAGTGGGAAGTGGRPDAGAADAPSQTPASQPYPTAAWKPTASITAAGNADQPPNAFDGMIGTRWTTGRNQQGNETFMVDLGSALPVSRVVIDDTTHPTDFPAAYTVELSLNTTFNGVKMGTGARVTDIQFPQTMARYVRIRQTGMTPAPAGSWWSIDELRIYP